MAVAKKPIQAKTKTELRPAKKYYEDVDAFAACAVDQIEVCLKELGYSDLPPIKSLVTTLLKEEQERVQLNLETLAEFKWEKKYRKKCLSRAGMRFKEWRFDLSHFLESKMLNRYFRENDSDDFLSLCFKSITQLEYLYIKLGCESVEGDFVSRMQDIVFVPKDPKPNREVHCYAKFAYKELDSALRQYSNIPENYEEEYYWWAYSESQYYLGMLACEAGLNLKELQQKAEVHHKLSDSGKKGAAKRHAKTYSTQEFALAEYRKKKYKSMRQGAGDIEGAVKDYAASIGKPLSEIQAFDTIYGWIRADQKV